MEAIQSTKGADVWIEETKRAYDVSVSEIVATGGAKRFHFDVDKLEAAVFHLMMVIEPLEPDTVLGLAAVFLILVVKRFKLKLASVLQFGENFLRGGDLKPNCAALQMMLQHDYESQVTRYDTIKLSKAINVNQHI